MRTKLVIGIGFVAAVLVTMSIGWLVFALERSFPSAYSVPPQLPSASDLMNGVDKSVGMMFSLSLGLFVVAGFALRGMDRSVRSSRATILTAGAFLFGSVFAVYMGFMARTVALYYASFPLPSSIGTSGTFIVLQALGVGLSALCAILMLVELLLSSPKHEAAGGGD